MIRKGLSWILILAGIACLLVSGTIFMENKKTEKTAREASADILTELKDKQGNKGSRNEVLKNLVYEEFEMIGHKYKTTQVSYFGHRDKKHERFETKDRFILDSQKEMPIITIDGVAYIGTLYLPTLGLEFPVARDFDMGTMEKCPVVYYGSVYGCNAVLCAHNYEGHFREIGNMQYGEEVLFEDVDGNVFEYQVLEVEYMGITESKRMKTGDWDLTLFTCVRGQVKRVAVRCELIGLADAEGEALPLLTRN